MLYVEDNGDSIDMLNVLIAIDGAQGVAMAAAAQAWSCSPMT